MRFKTRVRVHQTFMFLLSRSNEVCNDFRWYIQDTGNLIIRDVNSEDDGFYTCVANNLAGVRKSKPILLTTQSKYCTRFDVKYSQLIVCSLCNPVRPYMIQAPKDTVAMAGSSVQLQCKIGGTPQPEVFWKKISNTGVAQHIRPDRYR